MWVKKANVSESLMTRRNGTDDIKTGVEPDPWDEPGGCLPIGQAASGVEAARAWSGLRCGTCEPVVPDSRAASGAVFVCGRCALARTPSSRSVRGESNDAGHRRGPLQLEDGTLRLGDRGSPQGSSISPVLSNIFLHYALDTWLVQEFPAVPFEHYADDVILRCKTRRKLRSCSTRSSNGWRRSVWN